MKRRNHISPLLMEALQILKFHLKKQQLNFTQGLMTSEKDMLFDDADKDLLITLLPADSDDSVDKAIKAISIDESDD